MTKQVTVQRGNYELVPLKDIDVEERCRMEFDGLQELADTIEQFGLMHPLTVAPTDKEGYKYVLVAGERRLRALVLLNVTSIPVFIRRDMDELERKMAEGVENLSRVNLAWQEIAELTRQQDVIRRQLAAKDGKPKWRVEDTAKVLGQSRTVTARNVALGWKLKQHPELREEVKNLPMPAAVRKIERIEAAKAASAEGLVVAGHLMPGNARDLLKGVGSSSVACVVTDPPFGMEELSGKQNTGGSTLNYKTQMHAADNSSPEKVKKLLKWFVPEMKRVLVDGGHFYIFYCQQLYADLRRIVVEDNGLEVQEYPLIWYKGRGMGPGRGYVYVPCTEPVLFGWKPPRKRMLDRTLQTLVEVPVVSANRKLHVFQKPIKLLQTFIKQSTIQGETVLDPFAGVASTVVAALRCNRTAVGFELDPEHFALGSKRVAEALKERGRTET